MLTAGSWNKTFQPVIIPIYMILLYEIERRTGTAHGRKQSACLKKTIRRALHKQVYGITRERIQPIGEMV
jgi:phage gp37-like protein